MPFWTSYHISYAWGCYVFYKLVYLTTQTHTTCIFNTLKISEYRIGRLTNSHCVILKITKQTYHLWLNWKPFVAGTFLSFLVALRNSIVHWKTLNRLCIPYLKVSLPLVSRFQTILDKPIMWLSRLYSLKNQLISPIA